LDWPFSTVHFAPNFAVHFAPFYASSYGSVGYLMIQIEDAFWESFDPAKPSIFRSMGKKPLKMGNTGLGQQPL